METKELELLEAQEKEAYGEGIRACAEGRKRVSIGFVYENPDSHVVRGFNAGFDAETIARSNGSTLY